MATSLAIWCSQALTVALLLWLRWRKEKDAVILSWSVGFLLFGLGLAGVAARGMIWDLLSIVVANAMVFSAFSFWIVGMQRLNGRRPRPLPAGLLPLAWVIAIMMPAVRDNFDNRLDVCQAILATGYLLLLIAAIPRKASPSAFHWLLYVALALQILESLYLITTTFDGPEVYFALINGLPLMVSSAFCFIAVITSGAQLLGQRSIHRFEELACTDPLTQILNRRGLVRNFEHLKAASSPGRPLIALLQFDLDKFKAINDLYGHQAGDAVLVAFAALGTAIFRAPAIFCRMGGEEFVCVLRVADPQDAARQADALRLRLRSRQIEAESHHIDATVSAGVAVSAAATAQLPALLGDADRALYAAKKMGRDRTVLIEGAEPASDPRADQPAHHDPAPAVTAGPSAQAVHRA